MTFLVSVSLYWCMLIYVSSGRRQSSILDLCVMCLNLLLLIFLSSLSHLPFGIKVSSHFSNPSFFALLLSSVPFPSPLEIRVRKIPRTSL